MNIDSDDKQIFEKLKQMMKDIKYAREKISKKSQQAVDIEAINEKTDVRELDMDSLDLMEYLLAIDEQFGQEIPDKVFEENELAIIGNLIKYLKDHK